MSSNITNLNESDYGIAPTAEMSVGQEFTVISLYFCQAASSFFFARLADITRIKGGGIYPALEKQPHIKC